MFFCGFSFSSINIFFFEESSNATNWNTIFRSDEHVFIWTTFISQFFRLLIYFKFWQFVSFLWAYIPSFKKKPIIFAWNKRPGFYLFHVKNHRMLGIINHQDEKLAAWILIPCAEICTSRLDFHFFLVIYVGYPPHEFASFT